MVLDFLILKLQKVLKKGIEIVLFILISKLKKKNRNGQNNIHIVIIYVCQWKMKVKVKVNTEEIPNGYHFSSPVQNLSINLSARVNYAFGLAKISNLVIGNARWPTLQNNVLT